MFAQTGGPHSTEGRAATRLSSGGERGGGVPLATLNSLSRHWGRAHCHLSHWGSLRSHAPIVARSRCALRADVYCLPFWLMAEGASWLR